MKNKILSIIILSLLFGTGVFAQETELPFPGLTPDSPFYFLEIITEGIVTFFTFGDLKKAERYAILAAERISEAKAMVEKGKPEFIERTLVRYEMQLNKSIARTERAKIKGKNTGEMAKALTKAAHKYFIVLEEVLKKAPKEAQPAIEQAMTVSSKGNERALEALPEALKNDFGFELLEIECIEAGMSSDDCALIEGMCKEAGAATPNECERVLSTFRFESSVKIPVKRINREE